jgi:hypothetical protein
MGVEDRSMAPYPTAYSLTDTTHYLNLVQNHANPGYGGFQQRQKEIPYIVDQNKQKAFPTLS